MTILADQNTRILVQGITGREAATFTKESLDYGARIVAGVTPGKGGMSVHGVPVYDTVAQAVRQHPCDAAVISTPARFVRDAALETLASRIPLMVILTERIPRRDVVLILETAAQVGTRVIGPNSLGIISPDYTRVGMAGGSADSIRRAYRQGYVGVVSRSGGMMTEIANMLTRAGIGQSTCVSIGGDPMVGSTVLDLLPLYEADPQTQALVIYTEPGGDAEERLGAHLQQTGSRLPIIAFIAGRFADRMQGVRFGHAGSIVRGKKGSPAAKAEVLRAAGVRVAEQLSDLPRLVGEALAAQPSVG